MTRETVPGTSMRHTLSGLSLSVLCALSQSSWKKIPRLSKLCVKRLAMFVLNGNSVNSVFFSIPGNSNITG